MNLSYLKYLLNKHGITQTDLAHILGRDKSVITNLFQGKRRLKADEAALIATHIGVPVAQILGIEENTGGLLEAPVLIPFQHEPTHARKRHPVIRKDGKFFLDMGDRTGYTAKAYALEAQDDSMNLAGILPGDIIISELDQPCKPGQIVIVQHYQSRGAKTLIRRYEPPYLLAQSTTAGYKILSADSEEVRLVSPLIKLLRVF